MSAIDSFSSPRAPAESDDAFNTLSSAEFLQIMFTELRYQDPMEPQDSQAMLNQLSSLRSIESDSQMVTALNDLVGQNEFAAASQMIGSLVSGITLDNRRVADLVISVSQTSEGPILNLFDGSRMFFDQVDEIVGPIDPPADPDPDDPTPPIDDDPDDPKGLDMTPIVGGKIGNPDPDEDQDDRIKSGRVDPVGPESLAI